MRSVACLTTLLLAGCAGLIANKHTYGGQSLAELNGARIALRVKPEGTAGGSFMLGAMVVAGGVATLDGPFRWRIEAVGAAGRHESLVVHRLRTRTAATGRDEWYPVKHLGRRVAFQPLRSEPGQARAVFEIPGTLQVKPRVDGALRIVADLSVTAAGRTRRALVAFRLDPAEKRADQFVFLPAEIVRSFGDDPAGGSDEGWD